MSLHNHAPTDTIHIISPPLGEAPLWVREAWIGLDLPVRGSVRSFAWRTSGVITGPKSLLGKIWAGLTGNFQRIEGYRVSARQAIDILDAKRPDAADWWRQNASHLLSGNFIFDNAACSARPIQNALNS